MSSFLKLTMIQPRTSIFFDLKGDTAIMVRKEIRYEPDVVIKNTQDKREVEKYV
ncbi:Uncharacterised protein [Sphingobacterium spiritivorum]|uniref:Uncharacterized protein n=1 Tax=Sphingobacterium spiritivorum TaxID=258 RepID=A0A380BJT4_SPHSI|nr:Uncharacterised protein [Sphingobacterium spiritivorum]